MNDNINKEIFLTLVSSEDTETKQAILFRTENKAWLRESKRIAVKVLLALKEQNLTQKDLSEKMNVSPQYINKLVKGKENLTLETICKLQDILKITILAPIQNKKDIVHTIVIPSSKSANNERLFNLISV